jgi:hypothetical protein
VKKREMIKNMKKGANAAVITTPVQHPKQLHAPASFLLSIQILLFNLNILNIIKAKKIKKGI